ncbi:MAG: hypothetical protein ACR2OJ_13705 [Hyphomicrobiales bacterium]
MPISLGLGLLLPDLAAFMRPAILPTVFFMLSVLMTRINLDEALLQIRSPIVPLIGLIWTVVAVPIIFALVLWLLAEGFNITFSAGLVLAFMLWASSPPIFSSAPLSYIMRLDGTLSVGFLMAAIALHPIVTPLFVALFTDGAVSVPPIELAIRLTMLIGGAAAVAFVVRKIIGKQRLNEYGSAMDGLNVIALIVFAIAIMDGIGARLLENPVLAASLIAFAFGAGAILHVITSALFWRYGKRRALTIGLSTHARNIAMAVGAMGAAVPPDTWLFFAMIQFPIYILPAILHPVYNRILPQR